MSKRSRSARVRRLDSVGGIVAEMDRIYRIARRGEIDADRAHKLIQILRHVAGVHEAWAFERRIEALEAQRP